MVVDQHLYRKAFQAYLRQGTPIAWTIKQERPTSHYIWRTREDGKVRPSHAANDGQIFAWDDPPPTGNPGEEYGCRCTAEPYYPGVTEYVTISFSGVSDSGPAWSSLDFVKHYFQGNGVAVTVRETGHLEAIVTRYMEMVERKPQNQIASTARRNLNGTFYNAFRNTYDMTSVEFSIGDTTIGGNYTGFSARRDGMMAISGEIEFYLTDEFVEPLDIHLEVIDPGSTIYENLLRPLDESGRDNLGLPPMAPLNPGIRTGAQYVIADALVWQF